MSRLSESTIDRLHTARALSRVAAHRDVIAPSGAFFGFFHAVLPVSTVSGLSVTTEVWCADRDGSIVFLDCAGNRLATRVPSIRKTFAKCFVQQQDRVWVGYEDGYIRVYDARTKMLGSELRQHSGSVNSITTYSRKIVSGGSDFKIVITDVDSGRQFASFQTAASVVRKLLVSEDFLFCGGDDGCLRCFDLPHACEVISPDTYPIKCFKHGGVRDVAVWESTVLAAGANGVVMLDVETCAMVHFFDVGGVALSITVIPTDLTLWIQQSDGTTAVFDLVDFSRITELNSHSSSIVKDVVLMSRRTSVQLWGFSGNEVSLVCDAAETLDCALESRVQDFHSAIGDLLHRQHRLRQRSVDAKYLQHLFTHTAAQAGTIVTRWAARCLQKRTFETLRIFLCVVELLVDFTIICYIFLGKDVRQQSY